MLETKATSHQSVTSKGLKNKTGGQKKRSANRKELDRTEQD